MVKGLEGIKVIEVGGAFAMPLAGMLMGSWGAEVIHVEPPGQTRPDLRRDRQHYDRSNNSPSTGTKRVSPST